MSGVAQTIVVVKQMGITARDPSRMIGEDGVGWQVICTISGSNGVKTKSVVFTKIQPYDYDYSQGFVLPLIACMSTGYIDILSCDLVSSCIR